jgi:hypothetical protein
VPRYYFHVHNGEEHVDGQGIELPDEGAARREAVAAAAGMLSDLSDGIWHIPEWTMHVVDQEGIEICNLLFRATGKGSELPGHQR